MKKVIKLTINGKKYTLKETGTGGVFVKYGKETMSYSSLVEAITELVREVM